VLGGERERPARVVVVDDHPLVRRGFAAVLSSEPDLEVVDEAEDGLEALELCREACPDLVLMDISMPNMGGREATQRVKEHCPETLVLVLTAHEDDSLMLEALRAGAVGYLLKVSSPQQLVGAVQDALGGESLMDPRMAGRILRRLADEGADPDERAEPTSEEQEQASPRSLGGAVLDLLPTQSARPCLTRRMRRRGPVLSEGMAGTNELAQITQRRLIEISDEDAAHADNYVGYWGSCDPHPLPEGAVGGRRVR
jgi:DNA-binding NarL/FixJ family response regulator